MSGIYKATHEGFYADPQAKSCNYIICCVNKNVLNGVICGWKKGCPKGESPFKLIHLQFNKPIRAAFKSAFQNTVRLEKDGWTERRQYPQDRRSLKIYLTDRARQHKDAILGLFEKINQEYLNRFTTDEWAKMQDLLTRLEQ